MVWDSKKCAKGLACYRNKSTKGVLRCKRPLQVGDECNCDEVCQGLLKCSINYDYETGRPGHCYHPSLTLSLGDRCSPKPGAMEKRCAISKERGIEEVVMCLPNPNGTGFKCQKPASLFDRCSAKKNIGCYGQGLICNHLSVCTPRSQVQARP